MAKIIHILFDDLGWGDMPSRQVGGVDVTPEIAAMVSAEFANFRRFYVASPVCSASRFAWLSGRKPNEANIWKVDRPESDYREWIPKDTPTVHRLLKASGHATGHFGKWHMGTPPQTVLPRRLGIDRLYCGLTSAPNSGFFGHNDYVDAHFLDDEPPHVTSTGFADDRVFDEAIEWLQGVGDGDFIATIWPFTGHELLTQVQPEYALFSGATALREYASMLRRCDSRVKDLRDALVAMGVWDDCVVVISSDNGPESAFQQVGSAGGLTGWKGQLWEGGIRVPCFLKAPGVVSGNDSHVRWALDFLPTALAVTGTTYSPTTPLEGQDMRSVPVSRVLRWVYLEPASEPPEQLGTRAILRTSDDLKIHADGTSNDAGGVFYIGADPTESTDLRTALPTETTELETLLAAWNPGTPTGHNIQTANPANEAEALEIVSGTNATFGLEPAPDLGQVRLQAGESITVTV